ncbi:TCTEX1D2 [Acanthosepion pharaonis]|uniref:TCTEX1D2 n=1 Tax=Acanthosepion pharaonis TaxID=158019 RepID=A0A812BB66_ACAPH|nr:TCTEX1D2 [Sepia pharaonis]
MFRQTSMMSSDSTISLTSKKSAPIIGQRNEQGPRRRSLHHSLDGTRDSGDGPSFLGLLASKRFAKKISSRFFEKKRGLMGLSSRSVSGLPLVRKEPTYRMEPTRKFCSSVVHGIIKRILTEQLTNFEYAPRIGGRQCMLLSEEIRNCVRALNFDRYKIVCFVVMGENKDQDATIGSRCAWDDKVDCYACYTHEAATWYCTATVYGIYTE